MIIASSIYFVFLVMFLFFVVKMNKDYRQAIKNGDITKEEIEKKREKMSIW